MKLNRCGFLALALGLAGCATSDLPRGARLAGGGLQIEYTAPENGTAILRERTSGRIVATQSLEPGDDFEFGPARPESGAVLFSMFALPEGMVVGSFPHIPTNTFFELYFVPVKLKDE